MKYECIKQLSHPNMGVLFKKGRSYECLDDKEDVISIGGFRIYREFLKTHFKQIMNRKELNMSQTKKYEIRYKTTKDDGSNGIVETTTIFAKNMADAMNEIESICQNDRSACEIEKIEELIETSYESSTLFDDARR